MRAQRVKGDCAGRRGRRQKEERRRQQVTGYTKV